MVYFVMRANALGRHVLTLHSGRQRLMLRHRGQRRKCGIGEASQESKVGGK